MLPIQYTHFKASYFLGLYIDASSSPEDTSSGNLSVFIKYSESFYSSHWAKDLAPALLSLSVGISSTSAESSSLNGKVLHCAAYLVKKSLICYVYLDSKSI